MSLCVAAIQMISGPSPADNLRAMGEWVALAADAGACLVAFPEATMACVGTPPAQVAEPLDGPFADGVRALAQRHGVTLVVGMYEPSADGRTHNTLLATGSWGQAAYRKIHLFDALGAQESEHIAPGHEIVTFTAEGVVIGLATCFDIRFAEHFVALRQAGAELVVLPASWGDGPGKAEQWDLLTRARAMDAQAWLLAAGQAWVPPRGSAPLGIGRSVLCDPLGVVTARLNHQPGVLFGKVQLQRAADVRRSIPLS